ncbi:MAG TPA: alpha/beta hydrolase [Candidatus Dormibacteraeota bacterium]|nr:alpha/beta hydrolase [Candidatus Dormibacteraeota bacterium]
MKICVLALCAAFACCTLHAKTPVWQPTPGHTQIPIWPGAVPDAQPASAPESAKPETHDLVAGKTWLYVSNVSRPTMTVYSSKVNNTGVAVVVFPGGGFQILAIDLEGTEVCDWLTFHGITCVLLKYRVPNSGPHWEQSCRCEVAPKAPTALEDAQRTMGLVRLHAAEWHINPHKIGVIGFSAGGFLVAAISTNYEKRLYPAIDAADRESARPDFAIALYPGHLCEYPGHPCPHDGPPQTLRLNPEIHVTSQTPPTFLVQAENDYEDGINQSLTYYFALKKAGVPVEMHLYAQGGHGFGPRRTNLPITQWPELMQMWLVTIGMSPARSDN